MPRIRQLEITNYRSIKRLVWSPAPGINCLIGPGDSGKSSLLDAIHLCLGGRRTVTVADTDFHLLDVSKNIEISVTIGDLSDALMNLEVYGDYLRGFDSASGKVVDEPHADFETVLTLKVSVGADLEPNWSLYSDRTSGSELDRGLQWRDRAAVSPARIGTYAQSNLSLSRASIVSQLVGERPALGLELADAARQAKSSFGDKAGKPLADTLNLVGKTAKDLGVPIGDAVLALLDAQAVSIGAGAIALHSSDGVPLRCMGTGSSRLLVTGLQRHVANSTSIVLIDEIEFGLEPHRICRLLHSLGAKEEAPPLQVFMTTHSPVALKELSGDQILVVRRSDGEHKIMPAGRSDEIQGTLRVAPEAFLAKSVLVGEGASEVGFVRGLDQHWTSTGDQSFFALGGAYVDAKGGSPEDSIKRGTAFAKLGYRVLVLIDGDKAPQLDVVENLAATGARLVMWRAPRPLEDEIFLSLDDAGVEKLIDFAVELKGRETIDANIKSKASAGVTVSLDAIQVDAIIDGYPAATRELLARASRTDKNGWFKSITKFQYVGGSIVGPGLAAAEPGFRAIVEDIKVWMHGA